MATPSRNSATIRLLSVNVLFDVTDWIKLGLDVRALVGSEMEIFGIKGDADYFQAAAVIGFKF